ncbi:SPW repeat [Nocardia otitidiscaviarum]|uniref:SPW repeat n=1 Tax=Nocardia otitidiscaviarum TaxID=1823 RepID=A0A378YMK5_9NOCA|nr:SPW repeat protein [Nocardia otitidiscaviarum]SUA77701.1 SPW repeat [Nocardia otitidiscaviarum]
MIPQFVIAALGIWLMGSPAVLDYGAPAATSDRIAGPVLAAIGYLAAYDILRGMRWLNVATGGWLLLAPWVLDFPSAATVNSLVVGMLTLVLVPLTRGPRQRFGGGWASLLRRDPDAADTG